VKPDPVIWFKRIVEKGVRGIDKDTLIFCFFLLLSFVFWYLNTLGKDTNYNIRYPVRYINLPEERVLAEDLPSRLDIYLKGPGYSILKLKLSGNRAPLVLDISSVNYKRVPGSRTLSYYAVTSALIPKLKNQLRAECEITTIKPDTLFFEFDKIITKQVRVIPMVDVVAEKQYLVKGNIVTEPDTVTITGPKRILDTIKVLKTRYKRIKGVNETTTKSLFIETTNDFSISDRKVTVTIPVEQFTEAELKVPVKIINKPDSISIKIFPDAVTVKCLVAVSDYKKIDEIPFEVVLDLSSADLTSSEKIPVSFRNIPPFVSSLRVAPEKVDFLIEKKLR
jgi:hypothetical protein